METEKDWIKEWDEKIAEARFIWLDKELTKILRPDLFDKAGGV